MLVLEMSEEKAARKRLSRRRKKWNRRIMIAKACKNLLLTHVKSEKEEIWLSAEAIIDYIDKNSGRTRSTRSRNSMTLQEVTNRLSHMLALDFVKVSKTSRAQDRVKVLGGLTVTKEQRHRRIFKVKDIESLDQYIENCEKKRLECV